MCRGDRWTANGTCAGGPSSLSTSFAGERLCSSAQDCEGRTFGWGRPIAFSGERCVAGRRLRSTIVGRHQSRARAAPLQGLVAHMVMSWRYRAADCYFVPPHRSIARRTSPSRSPPGMAVGGSDLSKHPLIHARDSGRAATQACAQAFGSTEDLSSERIADAQLLLSALLRYRSTSSATIFGSRSASVARTRALRAAVEVALPAPALPPPVFFRHE